MPSLASEKSENHHLVFGHPLCYPLFPNTEHKFTHREGQVFLCDRSRCAPIKHSGNLDLLRKTPGESFAHLRTFAPSKPLLPTTNDQRLPPLISNIHPIMEHRTIKHPELSRLPRSMHDPISWTYGIKNRLRAQFQKLPSVLISLREMPLW